ncbi:hypothetical protein CVT25_005358, partial [Psilocybe cyanescens]
MWGAAEGDGNNEEGQVATETAGDVAAVEGDGRAGNNGGQRQGELAATFDLGGSIWEGEYTQGTGI